MYKLLIIVFVIASVSVNTGATAQSTPPPPVQSTGPAQTTPPAQTVSAPSDTASVIVSKDPRIDLLVRKQIEINEETTRNSRRNMPGFRIQVINSHDRNKVYAAKTQIYQQFPDLKPYLLYQAPNYKLRVGNFKTQEEAEAFSKQLSSLFPTGLYVIRDIIEVSPDQIPN